jgi:transposase
MPATVTIEIKETLLDLKSSFRRVSVHQRPKIKMLFYLLKGSTSMQEMAAKIGVSTESLRKWKNKYKAGGLQSLLSEGRGGDKRSGISAEQKEKIAAKLADPKGAFRSYKEAQAWLKTELGIAKEYHALNKYLKRNWGTKLKVGRKSHVKKDEAAIAVFKKPTRVAKTH